MKTRILAALTLLPTAGGCMQYLVQPPAPSLAGAEHRVEAKSYLGSELQLPPYVLAKRCVGEEQLGRVLVKRNFGQGLVSWLTFGLVAPATIVYQCANARQPEMDDGGGGEK
ncbi:MAG TPA: hypothetical protein VFZ91_14230 [Allosphingosinicella sp.]